MKNLRKLGATVALTCALAVSAVAGETSTPPCAPPEPGETSTPPCSAAPGDIGTPSEMSTASGDIGTVTAVDYETYFTKIVTGVLLNALPLF